ncbi:deoxyguanosinetriphosphate triphosphohydrolase [Thermodesulfobacteriota bacterium]
MSITAEFEKREENFISRHGCLSSASKGRIRPEEPCPVRTVFQLDRDRIVYSKAFRRLKHKTQVFLSPLGAHYRTRLTHTLEVAQMGRAIARAMRLNEDLTEAIALGHDLGHTPFGHGGETAIKEVYSPDFTHNEQSLRVVDILENNGQGLNLTHEVRDGILKHSKGYGKIIPDDPTESPGTLEGRIVRIADIMAYLNHDLDDAIRSRVITEDQVPTLCSRVLGCSHSERVARMIQNIIFSSKESNGELSLNITDEMYNAMNTLRNFLYKNVYRAHQVHEEFIKAKKILTELYTYFLSNEEMLQKELENMELPTTNHNNQSKERTVCDLIASLTDVYALDLYQRLFFPSRLV